MIQITYEINGKKINPNNLKNALEKAIFTSVSDSIKKSIGNVRCSEHRKAPSIKVKGRSIEQLSFEVSGCCEVLVDKIKKKLN